MKGILKVISCTLLLAGTAYAQDTIELSSEQMDQINAGAATAIAQSGGAFEGEGIFNVAFTDSNTETYTFDDDGFSVGYSYAENATGAFSLFGENSVGSSSSSSVVVIE